MSDTENKTILEELLEQTEEQAKEHKLEKAYHLLSLEQWEDADALFDEILKEEPENSDALMGKRIISRRQDIARRMDTLGARAYKIAAAREPENEVPFRNRMAIWLVLIALLVGAGIAAAFASGTVHFKWNLRPPDPTALPVETQTQPVESTKPPIIIPSFDVPVTTSAPEPSENLYDPDDTDDDSDSDNDSDDDDDDDDDDTPSTPEPTKTPKPANTPSPKPTKTPSPKPTNTPSPKPPEPPKPPAPDM